jgi:uncharacterized protein (DUF2237 family)
MISPYRTILRFLSITTLLILFRGTAMTEEKPKNILGTDLQSCCTDPMTGYTRDGYCKTNQLDQGTHLVCAIVTDEFLKFTKSRGNDLITPRPEFQFPGLKAGNGWCLCVLRWKEAYQAGVAPPIKPEATHEKALEFIDKRVLEKYY